MHISSTQPLPTERLSVKNVLMDTKITYAKVRQQIGRNGQYSGKRAPTTAQLDYLASLIVKGVEMDRVRWCLGDEGWGGRQSYQVSQLIDSIKREVER